MSRLLIALIAAMTASAAGAHSWYPEYCCSGKDCAPIDAKFVKERADGVHVNIPVGAHPMLKKQSYSAVVPYSSVKVSEDDRPHICLAYEGTSRFCFFMPLKGY